MKTINLTVFCLIFCVSATLSCHSFASKATDNLSVNQTLELVNSNSDKPQANDNNNSPGETTNTKPGTLFIINGSLTANNNKLELNGDFWGHDEDDEEEKLYPDNKVEIDIMNCAGYLASATTTYKGIMREVKLIPETVAADAVKKIRQCSLKPNDEITGSYVFGIAPRDKKRKDIKIGKVDTKKLYNALAKDLEWDKQAVPEKQTISADSKTELKRTKRDLTLDEDTWTDLDGDGQIDLVRFQDTPCDEKQTCTWIYRLISGKWKEVEYIYPA